MLVSMDEYYSITHRLQFVTYDELTDRNAFLCRNYSAFKSIDVFF